MPLQAVGNNTGLTTDQQDLLSKYYQQREVEFEGIVKPECWQQAYDKVICCSTALGKHVPSVLISVSAEGSIYRCKHCIPVEAVLRSFDGSVTRRDVT